MGVVAPISAVGAALLPVDASASPPVSARRCSSGWASPPPFPGHLAGVSREPDAPTTRLAGGLVDGVLAGLGFGVLFSAMGQVPDGGRVLAAGGGPGRRAVRLAVTAAALQGDLAAVRVRSEAWGLVAGLLAAVAVVAFLLATQTGLLTVAAVLTSLYPAITIAARRPRPARAHPQAQGVGLGLCAVAVALVAAG